MLIFIQLRLLKKTPSSKGESSKTRIYRSRLEHIKLAAVSNCEVVMHLRSLFHYFAFCDPFLRNKPVRTRDHVCCWQLFSFTVPFQP
jgi:hypothetical protein